MNEVVSREVFVQDAPWQDQLRVPETSLDDLIDGVIVTPFKLRADGRGFLTELLTQRDETHEEMVHCYQVFCEPSSVRAWVYHERQKDRLCFVQGDLQLVLYDIREDSPTHGKINVLDVGDKMPCRVTLPEYVVHGLCNMGDTLASFVNLPTRAYDPADPDKRRLPYPDPRIPHDFGRDVIASP